MTTPHKDIEILFRTRTNTKKEKEKMIDFQHNSTGPVVYL
jgi:hypothetical protein